MSRERERESRDPLIELRNIEKIYAGTTAPVRVLDDVSLDIFPGEFVAIVGASGSGKSTLMNILGCLDRPTAGSYRFAGREIAAFSSEELAQLRRETFGFVFQQYHLVVGLTAAENVELPAVYSGVGTPERRSRAAALLAQLGLRERLTHRPEQLSGGQQQRVSIARALMNGGRVLLADEPTGALDRASGTEVLALLQQLSAAGHTIIVITHDRTVASAARRTIELSDGRVVADSGRDERAVARFEVARPSGGRTLALDAREAVRSAFRALRINVVRTLLTLLGIIVGVASVVALLAVGEGTRRGIMRELEAFGTNRLYISPNQDPRRVSQGLTAADAELVATVPRVTGATANIVAPVTLRYGNVHHQTHAIATGSDFTRILNWGIDRGSSFDESDVQRLATVALLGSKAAKRLFPNGEDPLRQFILVNNVPFQIIGVLEGKGAVSGDSDDDETIIMPFSTGSQRVFGTPYVSWISVALDHARHADAAVKDITDTLKASRRMEDFHIFNQAAAVAAQTAMLDLMQALFTLTAIISLVVGGIGVMNIMLMTVTERRGEIGIRIAVGGRRSDVLAQFLTEAIVLASLGGVIGLALGWGVGSLGPLVGAKIAFTSHAAALAFGCAVLTGLLSGILPAHRASRLDPVMALARQ